MQDLKDEKAKASVILAAIGADDYQTVWKKTTREIDQVVSVLEKLRREYQEINY